MARNPRRRQARGRSRVGERFTVEVGPVAHGGHCVARVPTGAPGELRVVFVRHALPGERVVVEITDGTEGDRFWRGDAVSVLSAAPDRVTPPCPYAGPGRCGGCDFQHVTLAAQRRLKADVVREQLVRLGRLAPEDPLVAGLAVEEVLGDRPQLAEGLRWRTRSTFVPLPPEVAATAPPASRGMRKHRSHEVIAVEDCLITAESALAAPRVGGRHPRVEHVATKYGDRDFTVAADGFWQVHPEAPRVLVETVMDLVDPRPGEKALDLYAGVGLFAAFLADAVGPNGRVVAVEGNGLAGAHAETNLRGLSGATVALGAVDHVLATAYDEPFDVVVLDPPREGARRQVVEQVVARTPRAVAYVACDPAALARDVALFAEQGYRLATLRAFDLFPMTNHVECVALLTKTGSHLR